MKEKLSAKQKNSESQQFLAIGAGYYKPTSLRDNCMSGPDDMQIAILTVTSPIVINEPTRGLLAVETKVLLFCGWQNLNIKRLVCKQ